MIEDDEFELEDDDNLIDDDVRDFNPDSEYVVTIVTPGGGLSPFRVKANAWVYTDNDGFIHFRRYQTVEDQETDMGLTVFSVPKDLVVVIQLLEDESSTTPE